jgi:hypothetical protein
MEKVGKKVKEELDDARADIRDINAIIREFRNELAHGVKSREDNMSTIALAALIGILAGGIGAGVTVHKIHKSKETDQVDEVSVGQVEVQLQLTDLDLLKVPCSNEYIDKNSDLLCREMFCLMQTRGIDSQTSGQECSAIQNLNNTLVILDQCKSAEEKEECFRLFRERK